MVVVSSPKKLKPSLHLHCKGEPYWSSGYRNHYLQIHTQTQSEKQTSCYFYIRIILVCLYGNQYATNASVSIYPTYYYLSILLSSFFFSPLLYTGCLFDICHKCVGWEGAVFNIFQEGLAVSLKSAWQSTKKTLYLKVQG